MITIQRPALKAALRVALRAISARSPNPLFQLVRLHFHPGVGLAVEGVSEIESARAWADAESTGDGFDVRVRGSDLAARVDLCDVELTLTPDAKGKALRVKSGSSSWSLPTSTDGVPFPGPLPSVEAAPKLEGISSALDFAALASAIDPTLPSSGVDFTASGLVIGIDGKRVHAAPVAHGLGGVYATLAWARAVASLAGDTAVRVASNDRYVVAVTEGQALYVSVRPQHGGGISERMVTLVQDRLGRAPVARLGRLGLIEAVRRAAVAADTVTLRSDGEWCEVRGDGTEDVSRVPTDVAFDLFGSTPSYIIEAINTWTCDEVELRALASEDPVLFTDPTEPRRVGIVMKIAASKIVGPK